MKSAMMGVLLVGVAVLGVAACPGPARAAVFTPFCGGSVGPGGTVVMSSDILLCGDSLALTVVGPVVVDMAGHTVSCSPAGTTGIFVEGKGAILKNGVVRDCSFGVLLAGVGSHQLLNMFATGNSPAGILVGSDHNSLSHNGALDSFDGIQIFGKSNVLSNNIASNNRNNGFSLFPGATLNQLNGNIATANPIGFDCAGGQGKFTLNLAISNRLSGFLFEGSGGDQVVNNIAAGNGVGFSIEEPNAIVNGNRASGNQDVGIEIGTGSAHSLVTGNIALGNGSDLLDHNANCGTNTWVHNIFGSGSPGGCIH